MTRTKKTVPKLDPLAPPEHLGEVAKAFWVATVESFIIERWQRQLLVACAEACDRCEKAREVIAKEGASFPDRFGQPRIHPLVLVERDARAAYIASYKALGLDVIPAGPTGRPPGGGI